jgi:hypothetical protein
MIIDATGRVPQNVSKKAREKSGQNDSVKAGDVVEVEVIRNGKTISKGR